jgi:phage terminase Nu1 subunit (DNA packaging protein)
MTAQELARMIKADLRAEGFRLLNEAEHARVVNTPDVQFAATTAAATIQLALDIVSKWERQL